jgi:hypothetical protein
LDVGIVGGVIVRARCGRGAIFTAGAGAAGVVVGLSTIAKIGRHLCVWQEKKEKQDEKDAVNDSRKDSKTKKNE